MTLTFEADANKEHQQILQAKTKGRIATWELGSRLLRFKQTGAWKQVTEGGPYDSFTDYLERGVSVSLAQAKVYLRAAELPLTATLRFGIQGASLLSAMVELTPEAETIEQAMALELEGDDGKPKPFASMTEPERERSLARLRDHSDVVVAGANRQSPERQAANALRDQLREAAAPHLKPGQLNTRLVGGNALLDLKAIPIASAAEVFEALAKALKK